MSIYHLDDIPEHLKQYFMPAPQIGLEETPEKYVAKMVEVFREVKRVLRDDGTLWLNLGDSYAAQRGGTRMPAETLAGGVCGKSDNEEAYRGRGGPGDHEAGIARNNVSHRNASSIGLKHKDLIGIPWKVAFALQADGWYLRQDIIWHKPNPMPESVKDRCTKAHEYIFLLSKSPKYFFDSKAILEDAKWDRWGDQTVKKEQQGTVKWIGSKSKAELQAMGKKNRRSVWSVTTKPFKGAHFATFPPDLIEPCILAGSKPDDIILDPFGGSGTVGGVCEKHGRHSILCELNADYISIMKDRVNSISGKEVEIAII